MNDTLPNGKRLERLVYDSIAKNGGFPIDCCDVAVILGYPLGVSTETDESFYGAFESLILQGKLEWYPAKETRRDSPSPEDRITGRLYGLPTLPSRNSAISRFFRKLELRITS